MNWIACADKLPPKNTFILGYGPRCHATCLGDDQKMMVMYFNEDWWDANDDFELFTENVTHWMPLPQPPATGQS